MKVIKTVLITFIILYLFTASVRAHAILASEGRGALFVKSYYDDGTPASFADVTVYGPGEEEFITGITDKNGVFAFLPDTAGNWKAVIDDGMGHRVVKNLALDQDLKVDPTYNMKDRPGFYGIVTGVSLIFGLWGVFSLASVKKYK